MKNCRYYKQLMYSLYDDELGPNEVLELENHMASCDECREFYNCAKKMKTVLQAMPRIRPSENFNILLREKIRRESAARLHQSNSFVRYAMPAFGIGMVVLAVGVLSVKSLSRNNAGNSVANRTPVSRVQYENSDNHNVNYVIEEYNAKSNEEMITDIDSHTDSLKSLRDTHHLKARITPVSF